MNSASEAEMFNISVSPYDNRYYDPKISKYLSMQAEIQYYITIELQHLELLLFCSDFSPREFNISRDEFTKFSLECENISAYEVYEIEQNITRHDITALVEAMKSKTANNILKNLIHLGLTSYDVIHTARSLQLMQVMREQILPLSRTVLKKLTKLALEHKCTSQNGRTHGQIASPTVFGHPVSGTVSRLQQTINLLDELTSNMPGKISGPVGTQAALCIVTSRPKDFESTLCSQLGLKSSDYSSQLLPPDHWMRVYDEIANLGSALSKFANDCRHLQRPEINEVIEGFAKNQKGSSAMPHKRNPIRLENIVGCQKLLVSWINMIRINQETEHQRDLTGSIVERFYSLVPLTAYQLLKQFNSVLDGLFINVDSMKNNLKNHSVGAISEALKTFLVLYDIENYFFDDHYEFVQRVTFESIETGASLEIILNQSDAFRAFIATIPSGKVEDFMKIINNPEIFAGTSIETINQICL